MIAQKMKQNNNTIKPSDVSINEISAVSETVFCVSEVVLLKQANQNDKKKSGLENMTEQEFLEMCRREAPEFTLIEEVTPSQATLKVYHNNKK